MEWHKHLYMFGLYASYALFFAALFGVWSYAPQYLDTLESVLQLYVAGFLVIRFNPLWGKKSFDSFEKAIFKCWNGMLLHEINTIYRFSR